MVYIFDALLLLLLISATIYGYKHGTFSKFYPFFKLFLGFALSGKYALFIGGKLILLGLLKATSYGVVMLIGFSITFGLYWVIVSLFEKINHRINTEKFKKISGATLMFLQTALISTFTIFILMQFTLPQKMAKSYLSKTRSYPYISRFYTRVLSTQFVKGAIIDGGTGIDSKELFIKTLKQAVH
jgi:hypothetical protein